MDSNYWNRGRLSRRSVLRGATLAGVGLTGAALIGCGGSDEGDSTAAPTPSGTGATQLTNTPTSSEIKTGGTLRVRSVQEPPTLDPYVNAAVATKNFGSHIYSRLFRIGAQPDSNPFEMLPEPEAAESAETEDGQHWVVKLREGIKFHDIAPVNGREMTTEDVMFSYGRLTADTAPNRTQFAEVIDVQAVDDYTLQFTTAAPSPTFLETIADANLLVIQPKEATTDFDPAILPIGSGPFMQTSRQTDVRSILDRHPDYFEEGRPYVDRIEDTVIPEYANLKAQFQAGNLDAGAITAEDVLELRAQNPGYQWIRANTIGMAWITFSPPEMDPDAPWRDERFRRAVSMSLDRAILNELAANTTALRQAGLDASDAWNNAQPASFGSLYWLDPRSDAQGPSRDYFQFNVEEAQRLYQAMGLGDDEYRYQYTTYYGAAFSRLAEAQGQMLTDGGLRLAYQDQDYSSTYITQTFLGNFNGIVYGLESSLTPGLYVERLFGDDRANRARAKDPRITELHEKQKVELDLEARTELLYEIQRINGDMMYYVPTQSSAAAGYTAYQPYVRGLRRTRGYGGGTEVQPHIWLDV